MKSTERKMKMYNTDRNSNLQMYHYQVSKDWDAVTPSKSAILETTMDAILESYSEFMQDLQSELQEAY